MKIILTAAALLLIPIPASAQVTGDQSPTPGGFVLPYPPRCAWGELALRHQIESIEAGQPDYYAMPTHAANRLRYNIERLRPSLASQARHWGALVSPRPQKNLAESLRGVDVYDAQFEHARVRWQIACSNSQGKIRDLSFEPPS